MPRPQYGDSDGLKLLKSRFAEVRHIKPKSSRTESAEVYLVATGLGRDG